MENVERKLLSFFPLLKSTFTSSLLKRTPLPIPGVMTSCAETETVLLQGPFVGTAVRSCLATPGNYLSGFLILAASKKKEKKKDTVCSSALPWGSRLWELVRSSFPGSIADARAHTCEWEHSSACVWVHLCLLARLPAVCPRAPHLYVPGGTRRRGPHPTMTLQLHPGQRCCWCYLGFAGHQGRARKRHHLCLQTCRTLILRSSQLGNLCCSSTEFCHNAAQVVFFSCTEEWARGLWEC